MSLENVRVEIYHDFEEGGVHKQSYRPYIPYTRTGITIERDRGDEQGDPVTGSAEMSFPGHDLNPNNVASDLYGYVHQNTPLRVLCGPAAELEDAFTRTRTDTGWGPLDTGQTWAHSGGSVPADYDVNGFEGTQTLTDTGTLRHSTVDTGSPDHLVRVIFDLSASDVTGGTAEIWITGRVESASNMYVLSVVYATDEAMTIQFKKVVGGVGDVVSADTASVAFSGGGSGGNDYIAELYIEGNRLYGKVWYRYVDEPTEWMLIAEDDDLTTGNKVGMSSRRNTGNTNSNLQARFHDFLAVPGTIRFAGEIADFRPRRAVGDVVYGGDGVPVRGDRWVETTSNGVLRRLGQGEPPALSALWVENLNGDPIAFWPFTDGSDSPQAASALPGGTPMTVRSQPASGGGYVSPPVWSTVSFNNWLEPIATVDLGSDLYATGAVNQPSTDTQWSGDFVFAFSTDDGDSFMEAAWVNDAAAPVGTRKGWTLSLFTDPGDDFIQYEIITIPSLVLVSSGNVSVKDGRVHHARLTTSRSGGNTTWAFLVDNTSIDSGTDADADWVPVGDTTAQLSPVAPGGGDGIQVSAGFFVVWDTASPPANAANAAVVGRSGELAADRLARLCLEEGIPFELIGDASDTVTMGPQPITTFVGNVAEIERTDSARIFESRHQPGLTMRTRRRLYLPVQTSGLVLDVDDDGVAPPLDPVVGDLNTVNDVTVVRPDGSSARSVDNDGRRGVTTIGRYPRRFEINPEVDNDLQAHADWLRHLYTQAGTRYPQVPIDLTAAPALALEASRMDSGHIIALDNAEPDRASLIVLGYVETIGAATRKITPNTGPAQVYDVGVYDDSDSRYDSAYSTTAAQITTGTSTSLSVAIEAGRTLWVTGSGSPQFPFDIDLLGARVTVTAISGASSPQTFTISTTVVNGVAKVIPSGTAVRLFKPVRYAL